MQAGRCFSTKSGITDVWCNSAAKALKEDKRGFFSLCMRGGTAKVVASEQQQGQRGPWAAMVAPFWPLSSTSAPK